MYSENFGDFSAVAQSNPLYATFIQPFTDIVDTGMYAVKRIGTVTGEEALGLIKQSVAALAPFVSYDTMLEIKLQTKQNIDELVGNLDQEYGAVLHRNIDALLNTTDGWGMMFLFNPGLILGGKLALKTPEIVASLIGSLLGGKVVAAGGQPPVFGSPSWFATKAHRIEELQKNPSAALGGGGYGGGGASVNWSGPAGGGGGMGGDYGGDYGGGGDALSENAQQQQAKKLAQQQIAQLKQEIQLAIKKYPGIQSQITQSPFGKKIQSDAIETVVSAARKNLAFNNWQTLLSSHPKNNNITNLDKQITDTLTKEGKTPEEIMKIKNDLVPDIKKQSKQMFVTQLNNQQKGMASSPDGQKALAAAINDINSIA